jgi:hypothetical protein
LAAAVVVELVLEALGELRQLADRREVVMAVAQQEVEGAL